METETDAQIVTDSAAGFTEQDLTGRDRLTWNVLASWAGHSVFVITGFILPRLIDRRIGQEALGVWDFGWALVSYFGLVSGGVMTAVSRYVAQYRAAGEADKLNSTVSTGLMIYLLTGTIVLGLAILASALVPALFSERVGYLVHEAQWVVLLLGLSMTIQFVFSVFNGVLTGCHRWGTHNAITSGVHAVVAGGMILSLVVGGGLRAMAAITLAGEAVAGMLRVLAAYRSCPGLSISYRACSWASAREMIHFGAKTMLGIISYLVMYQATGLLIFGFLGPAALALYARPAALVRHARMFVNKFANVLAPTASALHAGQEHQALEDLLVKGTRYGLFISLPMVLVLTLLGGPLLRVWMGDRYDQGLVLAILAVGHLASFSQQATYQILVGLGHHGLPAAARLTAALCVIPVAVLGLGPLNWGLVGAALAIVIPLTFIDALVTSWYACRVLRMPYRRYIVQAAVGPLLAVVPFAACLLVARYAWPNSPFIALTMGLGLGAAILGVIYWYFVVPPGVRTRLSRFVSHTVGRSMAARA